MTHGSPNAKLLRFSMFSITVLWLVLLAHYGCSHINGSRLEGILKRDSNTPSPTCNGCNSQPIVGRDSPATATTGESGLRVDLVNNWDDPIKVYVTAKDAFGRVMVLNAHSSWSYPTAQSATVPQMIEVSGIELGPKGSVTSVTVPDFFVSGRLHFAAGDLVFRTLLTPQGVALVLPNPLDSDGKPML